MVNAQSVELRHDSPRLDLSKPDSIASQSQLNNQWHSKPPPVLQHPCLAVDRHNDRTFIIGYDSQNALVFHYMNSTEACDSNKREKHKGEKADGEEWRDKDEFDWQHAHWTLLPYPGSGIHDQGRRYDTDNCFLSSDYKFMVPAYEAYGDGGFFVWDHEQWAWTHARIDTRCSCHEEEVEESGEVKVKKDSRWLTFEYPNLFAVVYQSYRAQAPRHGGTSRLGIEEALDTVVIHWKDKNDMNHLTGIQLVNHKVYSCHDITVGRDILPSNLTLAASPNNPYHYTFRNTPKKYTQKGDHGSRCDNTTLFLFGPQGSGWFDISIADRPSTRPVDIVIDLNGDKAKGGFNTLSTLEVEHPQAVYYGGQLWIFGKNHRGVGVWSIDTSSDEYGYQITAQSQGGPTPGSMTCASCGDGIIVYGSCDRAEDCSANLLRGDQGPTGGSAPVAIYIPGVRDDGDDEDEDEDDGEDGNGSGGTHEGGNGSHGAESGSGGSGGSSGSIGETIFYGGHGGSGSRDSGGSNSHVEGNTGGSGSGSSGPSGSGDSGASSGSSGSSVSGSGGFGSGSSGSSGSGGSDSGSSGSGSSDSGGSDFGGSGSGGSGSGGSGFGGSGFAGSSPGGSGSGGSGSGGSGSGGSGSGGSGSGGSGSGGSGSGGSGSGGSGSGGFGSGVSGSGGSGSGSGSGGFGSGGSWSPDSGIPAGVMPDGVPGAIIPSYPYPNPDATGQVMVGVSQTATPVAVPSNTGVAATSVVALPTNGLPEGAKTNGDGDSHNIGTILGGFFGFIALIALVSLIFLVAKKRRQVITSSLTGAAAGGGNGMGGAGILGPEGYFIGGAAAGGDNGISGAGILGPEGYFIGGADSEPKYTLEGPTGMPDLSPIIPVAGGSGASTTTNIANGETLDGTFGSGSSPTGAIGTAAAAGGSALVAGAIANNPWQKEPANIQQHEEVLEAGHVNSGGSSSDNSVPLAKRSSKAKFFMGGGDYKLPLRRPNPVSATLPITATGPKTEIEDDSLEGVEVIPREEHASAGGYSYCAGVAGAAGVVGAAGVAGAVFAAGAATAQGRAETQEQEVTSSSDHVEDILDVQHDRHKSTNSTNMNLSESSSIVYQGGVTGSSTSSVTNITRDNQAIFNSGKTITVTNMSSSSSESERIISGITVVADGVITGAGIASQHQTKEKVVAQRRQTQSIVHKTLINIKLSITRYERADAALATPNAKPGTLMLSQVEMLGSAPDINISGSAFSHVRESSKGRAVPSSESAPRELSLRWMKNESQWKREAGMLQKLKSDKYIVEHFRLYTLPTFAEYRFVSVLGPFTSTLESYSKERKSNTSVQQGSSSRASPPLSRGPLTLAEIKAIADSIASALKWCHDNRVVHLNLTPESIFLQEFYSEPDGQGGYRTSFYSSYSNKSQDATTGTGSEVPRIEHHWKLWNFGNARFVHEAVDLNVDMTPYTAPEILLASRRNQQRTEVSTIVAPQDPNKDTSVVTTVSADGVVTITTTRSTSGTAETSNRGPEELKAATSMDMWSLGGILYEMYTSQPMFTSSEDALVKLTSALEKGEAEGTEDDDDLDKAEAHDKIRQQLQDQIEKIEGIEDKGAREAIASLVKLEPERRWDHALLRECYFDMQE